jgi:hypothetical protein
VSVFTGCLASGENTILHFLSAGRSSRVLNCSTDQWISQFRRGNRSLTVAARLRKPRVCNHLPKPRPSGSGCRERISPEPESAPLPPVV